MSFLKKRFGMFALIAMMLMTSFVIKAPAIAKAEEDAIAQSEDVVWRHFKSGSGNDNGANSAMLKSDVAGAQALSDGAISFTYKPLSVKTDTRFGVYLKYIDNDNFVKVETDASSNWFYQHRENGQGNYSKLNIAAPQQGEETNVDISWKGKELKVAINGTFANDGNAYIVNELESFKETPLHLRAGSWGDALTDILFKDVVIKDGTGAVLSDNGKDTWSLTDTTKGAVYEPEYIETPIYEVNVSGNVVGPEGQPLENASIAIDNYKTTSNAQGAFTIPKIPTGEYTLVVSKAGLVTATKAIDVVDQDINVGTIQLEKEEDITFDTSTTIASDKMSVAINNKFPTVLGYTMLDELEGRKFYGNTTPVNFIKINGKALFPKNVDFSKTKDTATYVMTLKDEGSNIDAVITAKLKVEGNELTFKVSDIVDNQIVKTIEFPGHNIISARSNQANATFAGATVSTNTHNSGDTFSSVEQLAMGRNGYTNAFISTSSLSASIWSNSENDIGKDWTRITSEVTKRNGYTQVGLSSTYWTYQKDEEYRKENSEAELPCVKVTLTGDINEDAKVDWQDGAIAYRDIMKDPVGSALVADRVAIRVAMNFGSQAQNPFLMTLDNVKKVNLSTDGLGQSILLKGYGSEGHDSGHLNYADIGSRIGGAQDMKTLLKKGKDYGATFGVHVNASETYPESIYFEEDRLLKRNGNYAYGWNWLDQGINIDANYDLLHGRADRFKDFYDALGGEENDLDFIYVDVWGNGQSGDNKTWASAQLAKEINNLGWRLAGEWGHAFAYDSTFQHWASDLTYGGYTSKGINSNIIRFIQNHQKDSWVGDYPKYGGAAINPLLGGYDMRDFEGWQGRNDYDGYIENLFDDNLATKFVQHFKVSNWENGTPVEMTDNGQSYTWTPEMKVTLKSDDAKHKLVIERQSNDLNKAGYQLRTMTFDDKKIMDGEKYLIPWFWDENGKTLAREDEKLYHWNQKGGTTTWEVPQGWSGNVKVYRLGEDGKEDEKTLPIINGNVTLEAKASTPYVIYKTAMENATMSWSEGMHLVDTGFNSGHLDNWTIRGGKSAANISVSSANNRMLAVGNNEKEVVLEQTLSGLKAGQQYAAYVGVDNRSDSKAYLEIDVKGETISNYTERSIAKNYIQAYAHNTRSATVAASSYFQNMYVFFNAPEDGSDVTLRLKRDKGEDITYFDDIRVFENESNMNVSDTKFVQGFEEVPQGIFPFVVGGVEGVTDNRTHLSQYNAPYTQRGWNNKRIDDVIEGEWSVKTNGLTQRSKLLYQTIPQNYRFEPGVTYNISFDYEVGSTGTYGVMIGDGEYEGGLDYVPLEETISANGAKTYKFRMTGSQSGQSWFGIYSTDKASDNQGTSGGDTNFGGYKDIILDNVVINETDVEKAPLEKLYNDHLDLYEENYSQGTWTTFTSAMEKAKTVLDDFDATQEVVDTAKDDLQLAIDNLEVIGNVVKGSVRDTNGSALANISVKIMVDATPLTTTTDNNGKYEIAGVPFDTWDMVVDSPYYERKTEQITSSKDTIEIMKNVTLENALSSASGKVSAVGKAMPKANVIITSGRQGYDTMSDEQGNYKFENIKAGKYTMLVVSTKKGYDVLSTEMDVQKDKKLVKNVMLEPKSTYDYVNGFDDGTTSWKDLAGNTTSTTIVAENNATTIKFAGGGHTNVYDSAAPKFKNGAVEMDLKAAKDSTRLGVLLRANDMDNRIYVGTLDTSDTWFVEYWGPGGNVWSSGHAGPAIKAEKSVHLKVEIVENVVKLWVNNEFVLEEKMMTMPLHSGSIGLNTRSSNEVCIDNVKVTSYDPPTTSGETVAGHISDAGKPVEGVNVEIAPITRGIALKALGAKQTTTDENGNYKFKNLPFGEYEIKAVYDGETLISRVSVKAVEEGYIIAEEVKFNPVVEPEVVDKTALQAAISEAETLSEGDYTQASWEGFANTLTYAKAVNDNVDATQEEVDKAEADLKKAQSLLTKVSKAELEALIVQAQSKQEAEYTADTWKILSEALTNAVEVFENTSATQTEIERVITDLKAALAQLELVTPEQPSVDPSTDPDGVGAYDTSNTISLYMMLLLAMMGMGYAAFKKKNQI
ncbi:MAG: endo-alpha-N-acetylgalactosaminidase family protein [Breznakia sp.]